MFEAIVKVVEQWKKVTEATRKTTVNALFKTSFAISKDAKASIENAPGASQPGTPPHSRRGLLRNAIRYDVDKQNLTAVIGPVASKVGQAGSAMEHGGPYKGQEYPARPFMEPAIERNIATFAGSFTGGIGV